MLFLNIKIGVFCCTNYDMEVVYMDGKEYLQQIRNADRLLNDKMKELEELENLKEKSNAIGENERSESVENQIDVLKDKIQSEIKKLIEIKNEVRSVINQVNDSVLMNVLHKRYLQYDKKTLRYKSWEQISIELGCSYQWICKLHKEALKKVEKIINS